MSAQNWEIFELKVCSFLISHFKGISGISFKCSGGKNSNEPDIKVFLDGQYSFSIEVKLSPAQAGQFVIEKRGDCYFESERGKNINCFTKEILEYINTRHISEEVEQSGIKIDCPESLISKWIVEHYRAKHTLYFITSYGPDSNLILLHIKHISKYFECSAVIRRKKSGSRNISQSKVKDVIGELNKHLQSIQVKLNQYQMVKKKLIIVTNQHKEIDRSKRYFSQNQYFLSLNEPPSEYVVKTLSKTNNVNVVFSLSLKSGMLPTSKEDFNILSKNV